MPAGTATVAIDIMAAETGCRRPPLAGNTLKNNDFFDFVYTEFQAAFYSSKRGSSASSRNRPASVAISVAPLNFK